MYHIHNRSPHQCFDKMSSIWINSISAEGESRNVRRLKVCAECFFAGLLPFGAISFVSSAFAWINSHSQFRNDCIVIQIYPGGNRTELIEIRASSFIVLLVCGSKFVHICHWNQFVALIFYSIPLNRIKWSDSKRKLKITRRWSSKKRKEPSASCLHWNSNVRGRIQ